MEHGGYIIGPLDDDLERRRRQAEAQFTLAWMKRYDFLIASYEALPQRQDLTPERIEFWRQTRRAEYRDAVGVEMEQREALRARLAEVVHSGDLTVEQVIETVRHSYRNGWGSGGGGLGFVGASAEDWV
jgi:hypothetical protein